MRLRYLGLVSLVPFSIASGQNGWQFHDWTDSAPVSSRPAASCAGLRSLTSLEFSIIAAETVAASGNDPEYCRVSGQILPEVRFQIDLPQSWNRRLYMFGNGGYAGEDLDAPNRMNMRLMALRKGFAVTSTNTGHDAGREPNASFARDREKLVDYAFRSLHVTATVAKKIVDSYYGRAAAHSYFDGCSTGGREGLIFAQRFPNDFDGIADGAPVLNFTGTMIKFLSTMRALAAGPIPESKLPLLASRIYDRCDAADGLKDGVIGDPRKCDFQPARDLPRCDTDTESAACFTDKQIETLKTFYGPTRSGTTVVFPGWPVGAEIAGPQGRSGWSGWIVNEKAAPAFDMFSQTFFHDMTSIEANRFDIDKDLPKLKEIHEMLDATDPDLSAFRAHGGKILMYHGWADPALNPLMAVGYYEHVHERMGPSTESFFRLFMVPGMFHCSGGVGTDRFDAMAPLVNWVEAGKAPAQIAAAHIESGQVKRTRPLCPYPQVARYKGTGSIDEAANFSCVEPN